jgi:hypothetical protein
LPTGPAVSLLTAKKLRLVAEATCRACQFATETQRASSFRLPAPGGLVNCQGTLIARAATSRCRGCFAQSARVRIKLQQAVRFVVTVTGLLNPRKGGVRRAAAKMSLLVREVDLAGQAINSLELIAREGLRWTELVRHVSRGKSCASRVRPSRIVIRARPRQERESPPASGRAHQDEAHAPGI